MTLPLSSAGIRIFLPEISKFCYIKKYRYRLDFDTQFIILFTFPETLKVFLILMMSVKMANPDLLKKQYFEIKIMTS